MAQEKSSNALAQYGPVAAPVLGVVLMIAFIMAVVLTSGISDGKEKLQSAVKTVRGKLDSTAVPPGAGDTNIPLPDSVKTSMQVGANTGWQAPEGSKKLLALPMFWQVTMDSKPQDEFAQYDLDGNGSWDITEFQQTPYFTGPAPRNDFKEWDRNPADDQISRTEHANKPEDETEAFRRKDTSGDGALTAKDGEITADEELKWDTYPYDGKIDLQEYIDRYKPRTERDLGPVTGVEAKIDPATMEIVVTWTTPALDSEPEDIAYMIERRAPETVAKRQGEYRKKVQKYTDDLRAWDAAFEKWWNNKVQDGEKNNKQLFPNKKDAQKQFAASTPRPVAPADPSEWEPVTLSPITGNEYRDSSFEPEVTYTYAVYMATQKNPKRGQKARTDPNYPDWRFYTDRTETDGHPVIVHNRIVMGFAGAAGAAGNISMMKWHSIVDESAVPPTTTWYRVQVTQRDINADDAVGGNYSKAEMKDRSWKMFDLSGAEVNPDVILQDGTKIDFTTGYTFVTKIGSNFLLNSRESGDFELPKDTGKDMVPSNPPSGDNALEVRCVGLKNGGKDATFEVTRWYKAGNDWLRVVMTTSVKSGGSVGSEVKLGSAGSDVKIFDATGAPASASVLKEHKDETVDLTAGDYGKLSGRTVDVGGEDFDIFGTLYKD